MPRLMENDFLAHIRRTEAQKGLWKRWFRRVGVICSLLIAALIFTTWLGSVVFSNPANEDGWYRKENHRGFFGTLRNLIVQDKSKVLGAGADRINVVFLGMGGAGHDGAFLTDTILLASIKPSTNEIALASIPRDLSAPIPGYGWRKINHANAFGELKDPGNGAALAVQVLESVTGQPIHYFIRMDFSGFEKLIDEVGGIDVLVERAFTDTQFPTEDHKYQTISFAQGLQHMDGRTALMFARSRHGSNGEGSDYARNARQQKVLLTFKNRVLSASTLLNPARLKNIYDTLQTHVDTNIDTATGAQLVNIVRDLQTDRIKTVALSDAPGGLLASGSGENAYALVPRDRTFREIQQTITNIFETTDSPKKLSTLSNAVGTSGADASLEGSASQTSPQDAPAYQTSKPAVLPATKKTPSSPLTTPPLLPTIEIQNGTWIAGLAARVQAKLVLAGFLVAWVDNAQNRPYTATVIYDVAGTASSTVSAIAKLLQAPVVRGAPPSANISNSDIVIILGSDLAIE